MSAPIFRLAVPAERSALEELQRRASLMWEEDRAALLANPDAIELPLEQAERIARADGAPNLWVTANTRALGFYDSCGFVTVGEVQTRFRPAPKMRKSIDVER